MIYQSITRTLLSLFSFLIVSRSHVGQLIIGLVNPLRAIESTTTRANGQKTADQRADEILPALVVMMVFMAPDTVDRDRQST